jgi:hypothetical protein
MSFKDFEVYEILVNNNEHAISKLTLIRHLSPILIERIYRSLPIKAFTISLKNKLFLNINISSSATRKIFNHSVGELSYDAIQKSIIIYFENETDNFEKIGYVSEGLENLKNVRSGLILSLEKVKS